MKFMMNIFFYITFLVSLHVSLSSNSYAACYGPIDGTPRCSGKINTLYIFGGSYPIVYVDTDGDETDTGCTPLSGKYLRLYPSNPMFKEIYSALLSAQLSDKSVNIRVRTNSSNCYIEYAMIFR